MGYQILQGDMNAVSVGGLASLSRQSDPGFIALLSGPSEFAACRSAEMIGPSCLLISLLSAELPRPSAMSSSCSVTIRRFQRTQCQSYAPFVWESPLRLCCRDAVLHMPTQMPLPSVPSAAQTLLAFSEWPFLQVSALLFLGHSLRADPAPCGSRCSASAPYGSGFPARNVPRTRRRTRCFGPQERATFLAGASTESAPSALGSRALRVASRRSVPRKIRAKTK